MTWVKTDDGLGERDVFERSAVGPLGGWLHICGLGFCNRNLTDGLLTRSKARRLIDEDDVDVLIDKLIAHGLWADHGNGNLEIVNYLKDQPSKEKVEKERARWAASKANSRARNGKSRRDSTRDSHVESERPVPVRDKGTAVRSADAPLPAFETSTSDIDTDDTVVLKPPAKVIVTVGSYDGSVVISLPITPRTSPDEGLAGPPLEQWCRFVDDANAVVDHLADVARRSGLPGAESWSTDRGGQRSDFMDVGDMPYLRISAGDQSSALTELLVTASPSRNTE